MKKHKVSWSKKAMLSLIFFLIFNQATAAREKIPYKITAYCSCPKCCGKYSDGRFASNKPVYLGGVACNWLDFGTKILINGDPYVIEDRGAKSLFGDRDNKIRHLDVYMAKHEDARLFGIKWLDVEIL